MRDTNCFMIVPQVTMIITRFFLAGGMDWSKFQRLIYFTFIMIAALRGVVVSLRRACLWKAQVWSDKKNQGLSVICHSHNLIFRSEDDLLKFWFAHLKTYFILTSLKKKSHIFK